MRSGAAAGHRGYFHEAAFYSSDEEFLAVVLPFLRAGVAAGEPTLATFAAHNQQLVHSALGHDAEAVQFVPGDLQYARPASTIRSYRDLLAEQARRGAPQIRVAGHVPHPGFGVPWHGWARYEAAVNRAYDDFPLWGLCPYDTRTAPDHVLADVARTHPRLATPDGEHRPNPVFEDPVAVLSGLLTTGPLPERTRPALDVADPAPGAARRAVRDLAQGCGLDEDAADDAVMAASEAVGNALRHGLPPVRLRAWPAPDRLVVAVTDAGAGPADPYVGLLPAAGSTSAGLGLWVVHQMCRDVTFHREPDGFTVRMVLRASPAA